MNKKTILLLLIPSCWLGIAFLLSYTRIFDSVFTASVGYAVLCLVVLTAGLRKFHIYKNPLKTFSWIAGGITYILLPFFVYFAVLFGTHSPDAAVQFRKTQKTQLDSGIEQDVFCHFPFWNEQEKILYLTMMFPHTDAGATETLMFTAEKWNIYLAWDEFAKTLKDGDYGIRNITLLRTCIGTLIAQNCYTIHLQKSDSGKWDLQISDIRSGKTQIFSTGFDSEAKPEYARQNSDIVILNDRMTVRYDVFKNTWSKVE